MSEWYDVYNVLANIAAAINMRLKYAMHALVGLSSESRFAQSLDTSGQSHRVHRRQQR